MDSIFIAAAGKELLSIEVDRLAMICSVEKWY